MEKINALIFSIRGFPYIFKRSLNLHKILISFGYVGISVASVPLAKRVVNDFL